MQQKHEIELNITLADGGSSAGEVIDIYGTQVRDDIDQTAWNLCDCSDQIQNEKFANLVLELWSVTHKRAEDYSIKALFTVDAQSADFVNMVINEYMDGFYDSIAATLNGYYSRTGKKVSLNSLPLNWEVEVK